jgi:plastocyanin
MRNPTIHLLFFGAATAALAACSGDKPAESQPSASTTPAASGTAPNVPLTPDPGGKIITVQMTSDDKGNYFTPAEVHAKKGDVVRYTLKVGVHNVHFLADSNAGKSGFPTLPSEMLQLPGQTFDVAVKMPVGSYYFQCDPHAALGMKGHVIVE